MNYTTCPAHGPHVGDSCPRCGKKGTRLSFDSKTEARRYQYLKRLEDAGIITGLLLQPEFEIKPRLVIKSNGIHNGYTQSREIYTADFAYKHNQHYIIEDTKGAKLRGKKRQVKPYVKTAARNKHKALIYAIARAGMLSCVSFLISVEYKSRWILFDSNHNRIQWTPDAVKDKAA